MNLRRFLGSFLMILPWLAAAYGLLLVLFLLIEVEPGLRKIEPEMGRAIQKSSSLYHEFIGLTDLHPDLVPLITKMEDPQFYDHKGISLDLLSKAISMHFRNNSPKYGGSSITQQLARTLFLDTRKDFIRKSFEAFTALIIESRYSKDRIMELYVNYIPLGTRIAGFGDAAQSYFNKPLKNLNQLELASIVSIMPSPMRYSPLTFRQNPQLEQREKIARNILLTLHSEIK